MNRLEELTKGYISKCEDIIRKQDRNQAEKLQAIIISTYGDYIKGITNGLDNYSPFGFYEDYIVDFLGDIEKIKAKLEIFLATECKPTTIDKNSSKDNEINIKNDIKNVSQSNNANTTNIKVEIDNLFEETVKRIEENESLSEIEINEVLEKIKEIKIISQSNESRNKKWFKLKDTMNWLGTKGLSVAINILPLITEIIKFNNPT